MSHMSNLLKGHPTLALLVDWLRRPVYRFRVVRLRRRFRKVGR